MGDGTDPERRGQIESVRGEVAGERVVKDTHVDEIVGLITGSVDK